MSIPKQPSEFILIGKDMTPALATGETLAASNSNGSLAAYAYDADDVDVSATIIEGAPAIDGNIVTVMTKAGDGVYNIKLLIPTSTGQVLEEDLTLAVVEKKST